MKTHEIPLTQGYATLIDEADYEAVSTRKWHAVVTTSGRVYARGSGRTKTKRGPLLHRLLMDPPAGMDVDHINGDPLDNRRANLRVCTRAANIQNSRHRNAPCVYFDRINQKWHGIVRANGKRISVGRFVKREDAIEAVRQVRLKYWDSPCHPRKLDQTTEGT